MSARRPLDTWNHCPSCGYIEFQKYHDNGKRCRACGYTLFSNPAAAAGVFLLDTENRFLAIRREREPRKGTWAVPGGFVDAGETLEMAAIRETHEEVGLQISNLSYLASFPNKYEYGGIEYATADTYFMSRDFDGDIVAQAGEVSSVAWLDVKTVDMDTMAFPSTRKAVEALLAYLSYNVSQK